MPPLLRLLLLILIMAGYNSFALCAGPVNHITDLRAQNQQPPFISAADRDSLNKRLNQLSEQFHMPVHMVFLSFQPLAPPDSSKLSGWEAKEHFYNYQHWSGLQEENLREQARLRGVSGKGLLISVHSLLSPVYVPVTSDEDGAWLPPDAYGGATGALELEWQAGYSASLAWGGELGPVTMTYLAQQWDSIAAEDNASLTFRSGKTGSEGQQHRCRVLHRYITVLSILIEDARWHTGSNHSASMRLLLDSIRSVARTPDDSIVNFSGRGTKTYFTQTMALPGYPDSTFTAELKLRPHRDTNRFEVLNYDTTALAVLQGHRGSYRQLRFKCGGSVTTTIGVDSAYYPLLSGYLFGLSREEREAIKEGSDSALAAGEKWQPDSYACNNAVRAYLYYLKQDDVLFPELMPGKAASFPYGSGLTHRDDPVVLKGEVSWDGLANNIYSDLAGNGNDLSDAFDQIEKQDNETWGAFLEGLQEKANKGDIIIGVISKTGSHGHVVALMPRSFYKEEDLSEIHFSDNSSSDALIALEAGSDVKKIKEFIGTITQITRNENPYIWFQYIN